MALSARWRNVYSSTSDGARAQYVSASATIPQRGKRPWQGSSSHSRCAFPSRMLDLERLSAAPCLLKPTYCFRSQYRYDPLIPTPLAVDTDINLTRTDKPGAALEYRQWAAPRCCALLPSSSGALCVILLVAPSGPPTPKNESLFHRSISIACLASGTYEPEYRISQEWVCWLVSRIALVST